MNVRTLRKYLGLALGMGATSAGRTSNEQTVWYVNAAHAAASTVALGGAGVGTSPEQPLTTIDEAIGRCTANSGHKIIVGEGHTESLAAAAAADADVAGITIEGRGSGTTKPTITLTTATTATFRINAANVTLKNLRFVAGVDSLVKIVDVNASYATFEDCDFIGDSTAQYLSGVNIATTMDYIVFRRCKWDQNTDPAGTHAADNTGAIYCNNTFGVIVEDCIFDGYFESACFHNRTTTVKHLTWRRNSVNQRLTTASRIILVVNSPGFSIGPDTDWVPGKGYPVQRATASLPATTTTAYFTISGGDVEVTDLVGMVTTVIQTQANNTKWQVNPTATGSSVDICAVLDVTAKVVGSFFGITGTAADAMLNGQCIIGQVTPVRAPPGSLDLVTAATNTGSVKWTVWWRPQDLSLGVPNVYAA